MNDRNMTDRQLEELLDSLAVEKAPASLSQMCARSECGMPSRTISRSLSVRVMPSTRLSQARDSPSNGGRKEGC